ncbi:RimK family alpha-L-glutamate ligase [bacterium]|nr:RimK family alpha-L-glutamate ligase [bacterium]
MRMAIIGSGKGWHTESLVRAAASRGHEATPVSYRQLVGKIGGTDRSNQLWVAGLDLFSVDRVIVRSVPAGSLEQVILRIDALHRLEQAGTRVLNSARSIEASVDKYLSISRLQTAGLLVPRTIVCERADDVLNAFQELGGDVVVKPLFGSEGKGIVRLTDEQTTYRVARTLEQIGSVAFVQEYIPHQGFDIRAYVLGDEIVASMRRWVAPGDFRSNVSQGGRAEGIELSEPLKKLARSAVRAVGASMGGVDLLPALDGQVYVIEVNSSPGFRALEQATGKDVAGRTIDFAVHGEW